MTLPQTLFLAWQNKASRRWYPVGRLDIYADDDFRFRYVKGVKKAREDGSGNPLQPCFPEEDAAYYSDFLFPIFRSRIMSPKRGDYAQYVSRRGLANKPNPGVYDILSVDGGRRVTDSFEVFPKIEKDKNGDFSCRFFVRGLRHLSQESQQRAKELQAGEEMHLETEEKHEETGEPAARIYTKDRVFIGYAPRYLARDLHAAKQHNPKTNIKVAQINPPPTSPNNTVLLEARAQLNGHRPMANEEYQPLVDYADAPPPRK